jgi:hypothetical protein
MLQVGSFLRVFKDLRKNKFKKNVEFFAVNKFMATFAAPDSLAQ